MKKTRCALLFLLCLVVGYHNAYTQSKSSSFVLDGTIQADTGTILLLPTGGKAFDPNTANNYESKIKKGAFRFEGQMLYPGSFRLLVRPNYISSTFIIEPG